MPNHHYDWIKIAESEAELSFKENNIAEITTGERTICIAKHEQQLYAFAAKCPHASAFFINGYVDALGNVVCPLHHYKFSIKNGRNVSGEGYLLKQWPVEKREDGIYVGFSKLSGLYNL